MSLVNKIIDNEMIKLFLRVKPAYVLVKLESSNKEEYASVVAKQVDCTYSHTVRILQIFARKGIVSFEKKGRIKVVELTKEGRKIAKTLKKLISQLKVL